MYRIVKNKAFTFLELTIFITIFAIILSNSLVIYDRIFTEQKISITKQKMQKIKQAFASYYLVNKSLPCPAFIRADIEDKYYLKQKMGYANQCFSESLQLNYYYGAVPVSDLGLSKDYLLDEWHNKISYILYKPAINFFNFDKEIQNFNNIECWIDMSSYHSLRLSKYFYLKKIIDKSLNNCNFISISKLQQPYYYSNFFNNQGGIIINQNVKMRISKNFAKGKYIAFLIVSELDKFTKQTSKKLIIRKFSFTGQVDEFFLDQDFLTKFMPKKNNIILHEFMLFNNNLLQKYQNIIKNYLEFKWDITDNNNYIQVKSNNKSLLANNAILLLISHGKNGKGAFNSLGQQASLYKISQLEKRNIYQITNQEFFIKNNILGGQNNFDDILTYMNYIELKTLSGN